MKVVIVESPAKATTIERYLGDNYKVLSSVGHIRDLAISGPGGLGVDVENDFEPKYVTIKGKQKVIKELKNATKDAELIYLATDPDREGEAISWHIFDALDLNSDTTERVVFNEITKNAVVNAIDNPRKINMDLVRSQETRRILDRIIGFKLSNLLQRKIKSKSAGRVQSVALKLVVDLEKKILAFIPEEYWEVFIEGSNWEAKLDKYKNKKLKIENQSQVENIINDLSNDYIISDIKKTDKPKKSPLPFITSTLQQVASSKYGYGARRTMMIAQKLYEGIEVNGDVVGLITYMRTDSTRLSNDFIQAGKSYIEREYGEGYFKSFKMKKSKNAQDAHEAIRPTFIENHPDKIKSSLTKEQYNLYSLIYNRAIAALMKDAIFEETIISIKNGDYLFKASGKLLKYDGYTKVYDVGLEKDKLLPRLDLGKISINKLRKEQKFTNPPKRFTEARLIKKMEELGIGRPSTYAQTMETLKRRNYVIVEAKKFIPTEQGVITSEKLGEYFNSIINVDYTADMENDLDMIANGDKVNIGILRTFYDEFIPMVDNAMEKMEKIAPKKTGRLCPECGSELVVRKGRYGDFVACSNYPECKYIEKEKKEIITTGVKCPVCKEGDIVERVATRGKNKGGKFYACNNFPKCKTILSGKPTHEHCPECGNVLVEDDGQIVCNDKTECGYIKGA